VDIIVLLKQVPDTNMPVAIAGDGKSIDRSAVKWVINPYDEFAVEEALKIREKHGGTVTILSVGGDKVSEAIRTALAMGADTGVLINDPAAADCDGMGIARILAAAIRQMPHHLIIAGQRAVDDDGYAVGAAVAEFLGIPHISLVIKQDIVDGKIRCTRTVEGGTLVHEAPLPALFTTKARILSMRLPEARRASRIIPGDSVQAKAAALVNALRNEARVI